MPSLTLQKRLEGEIMAEDVEPTNTAKAVVTTKKESPFMYILSGLLAMLLVATFYLGYQQTSMLAGLVSEVSQLRSELSSISAELDAVKVAGPGVVQTSAGTNTTTNASNNASNNQINLQKILDEITPKGVPDYGERASVSYDKVEQSLSTLTGYATLQLSSAEQERYNKIADTDGTACKYCCGATKLSQNCGCSHNVALQGLVKWLIKNTDYSDEQILKEIKNWQILFFPRPTLQEELERRNINPESVGLPAMRGGC